MFDLNHTLKQWRRPFLRRCSVEDLEELESHLREYFGDLKETGLPEEEAFDQAVARMGSPGDVGREFAKVRSVGDGALDRLRALDLPLLLGLLLICGMGLALLYSAGHSAGAKPYQSAIWIKQAVWIGLGFTLMFLVAQVKPERLMRYTPFIYGTSILLLILVLFAGAQSNGARSWFRLGGLSIQPSVLVLVTIPMMTAWLLTKREWAKTRKGFTTMLALILVPTLLIMCQPDLGMVLLCLGAGWITLFISDYRVRLVKFTCLVLPVLFAAGWFMLQPYQLKRIQVVLHPEIDPHGAGWYAMQIKEAVSLGGFLGRGWLNAESNVPDQHTDFILTVVAEQFGTVGVFVLMACFSFILYRAIVISKRSQETFCRCLGLGFTGLVLLQLALSVGMLYGWFPIVGFPLPLVSYGGSSLVLFLAGFGILTSIHSQEQLELDVKTMP